MTVPNDTLARALLSAGRRWRNRRLLEGLCWTTAGAVAVALPAIAFMDASRFQDHAVIAARVAVYLALLVLVALLMVARVPRSADARGLARYLERRDPALQALLLTAVEVAREGRASGLSQRLYARAAAVCDDPLGTTRDDRRGFGRAAVCAVLVPLAVVVALGQATSGWRHGAAVLAMPWLDARAGMPYAVRVAPGDVTLREGADLSVTGGGVGFVPAALTLVHRVEGETRWTRLAMDADGERAFAVLLPRVTAPLEYYLEGETVRSSRHRVKLVWLPRLERMAHRYHYPAYTGIPARTVEAATDIAAVTGTRVDVRVVPRSLPARGELVLDGETRRELTNDGDALVASLSVDEARRYRVELAARDGEMVPVTPEHAVSALSDGAPTVEVLRPKGDARVTLLEEVGVEVRARDDVSLRHVELVLSVNGEPEEVVTLDTGAAAASVTGTHTLYLETRGLSPGDLIALHARASDGVVARTAVSDIHFMQVRPFDRDFSRARSGGSQRGGGGQGQQDLSAQQRDLVVALFRLARDRERLSEQEQSERLSTLSVAQGRIRERVQAIVRRIQGRAMVSTTPGYKVMLEELPRAAVAMTRVEALLAVPDAEAGLPPAREALSHLQRADAAFREVQVASRQGGGAQGRAANNDLSRLFELEMDRFRNRYSQVQRSQAAARQQQVDETLKKLEELARRQREEVERARRRAGRSEPGSGGAATQQALAQQLEELLRRLERLSREQPASALEQAREALQQAAQAMRQSGGGGGGAQQAAREALERLEQARQSLAQDGPAQVAQALERARRLAESLAERQNRIGRRLAERAREQGSAGEESPAARAGKGERDESLEQRSGASQAAGNESVARAGAEAEPRQVDGDRGENQDLAGHAGDEQAASLEDIKTAMEADARALRERLDAVAGGAGEEQGEARRRARQAAGTMREADVEGRLRRSREELAAGVADQGLEDALAEALDRTRQQVTAAAQAARAAAGAEGGSGRQGQGAPTPEQLRSLMRGLADLREQLRQGVQGDGRGPGGRNTSDLESLAGGLERLRGPVASNAEAAGDLTTLIQGIQTLAGQTAAGATAGGPDQDALLDALAGVERALAASGSQASAALPADPDGRVPDGYRLLVDDYYRRLSSGGVP